MKKTMLEKDFFFIYITGFTNRFYISDNIYQTYVYLSVKYMYYGNHFRIRFFICLTSFTNLLFTRIGLTANISV